MTATPINNGSAITKLACRLIRAAFSINTKTRQCPIPMPSRSSTYTHPKAVYRKPAFETYAGRRICAADGTRTCKHS